MNSRMVVLIPIHPIDLSPEDVYMFVYTHTILIENRTIFWYFGIMNKWLIVPSVEKLLSHTDRGPEAYWPFLEPLIAPDYMDFFPLIVKIENRVAGVVGYFVNAYKNYIEDRIRKKVELHELQNRNVLRINIQANVFEDDRGYPFLECQHCLMLPILDEIWTQDFLKKPYKFTVWTMILIFLFYFAFILKICFEKDVFHCFLECVTITCGSVHQGFNDNHTMRRIIYFQLFLYGFITWNFFSSKLSSYLTSANQGRTLETLEDIKRANLTLLGSFRKEYLMSDDFFEKAYPEVYGFKEKLAKGQFQIATPMEELLEHLKEFNTSYGYLIPDYQWSFWSHSQELLTRNIFSFSRICPIKGHIYPLKPRHSYTNMDEVDAYFTMKVRESGLVQMWEKLTYYEIKFRYLRIYRDKWMVLGFQYFEVAWYIGFIGVALSCFVFVFEFLLNCSYKIEMTYDFYE